MQQCTAGNVPSSAKRLVAGDYNDVLPRMPAVGATELPSALFNRSLRINSPSWQEFVAHGNGRLRRESRVPYRCRRRHDERAMLTRCVAFAR